MYPKPTNQPFTRKQLAIIFKIAFLEAMALSIILPSSQSTGEVITCTSSVIGWCIRNTTLGLTFENTLPDGIHDAILGTGYSYQQKSCFMSSRYWLFWVNNGNTTIDHSASPNGISWSQDFVDWRSNPNGTVVVNDGRNFALYCDGTNFQTVVGGFTNGTDTACGGVYGTFYRRGTPNLDNSINWGNWFLAGCQLGEMQIAVDTNDRPMISGEQVLGANNVWRILGDSKNDGTWANRVGFPFSADTTNGAWWGNIVPLSNNQMYATAFTAAGTKSGTTEGRLWTGSAWQTLTVITSGNCKSYASASCAPSLTIDTAKNINMAWANGTGIFYTTYTGSWSIPTNILSTPIFSWEGGNSILLTIDSSNNLYIMWTEHFLNTFYILTKLSTSISWSTKQTLFTPELAAPPPVPLSEAAATGISITQNNLGPNNSLIIGWSANVTTQLSGTANQFFVRATYLQLSGNV